MAEQIITLGIGGTPASLTPFITTGLEIGAASVDYRGDCVAADVSIYSVVIAAGSVYTVVAADLSLYEIVAADEGY